MLPAHPTLVAIDLGDGPQVRRLSGDGGAQTVSLQAARHRHREGVDPGLGRRHRPHRAGFRSAQAARPGRGHGARRARRADRRRRRRAQPRRGRSTCRAGAARSSAWPDSSSRPRSTPPSARCSTASPSPPGRAGPSPITLPAGQQELLISPGAAFVVDGVQLAGPLAQPIAHGGNGSRADRRHGAPTTARWTSPPSQASRVLVVPESVNPGWTARTADGSALTPVTVNGWQQGWVRPAGHRGHRHAGLRLQRALPGRADRRAGAAAAAGAAGVLAGAPAAVPPTSRRGRGSPGRRDGERRGAGGRRGDLRASPASSWSARRWACAICCATATSSATQSRSAPPRAG